MITGQRRNIPAAYQGLTLLELTVVILVLLLLIGVLFIGARAWKRGSDRTACILNIRKVQAGVRAFSNLQGLEPGSNVAGLQSQIIGTGKFVEITPVCPGGGTYTFGEEAGADTIPPLGVLYLKCSLSTEEEHIPPSYGDW